MLKRFASASLEHSSLDRYYLQRFTITPSLVLYLYLCWFVSRLLEHFLISSTFRTNQKIAFDLIPGSRLQPILLCGSPFKPYWNASQLLLLLGQFTRFFLSHFKLHWTLLRYFLFSGIQFFFQVALQDSLNNVLSIF